MNPRLYQLMNYTDVSDLIRALQRALDNGYSHIASDHLGGSFILLSDTSFRREDNFVYLTIFRRDFFASDDDEMATENGKGEDYAHIKCKVLRTRIKPVDEKDSTCYETLLDIEPIEDLPIWYERTEQYDENDLDFRDDFRNVPIHYLHRKEIISLNDINKQLEESRIYELKIHEILKSQY